MEGVWRRGERGREKDGGAGNTTLTASYLRVEEVWRECGGSVEGVWRECGGSVEGALTAAYRQLGFEAVHRLAGALAPFAEDTLAFVERALHCQPGQGGGAGGRDLASRGPFEAMVGWWG